VTSDAKRRTRLIALSMALGVISIVGMGLKGNSTSAMAGPKGQFGADSAETAKYLSGLDFSIASTGDSIVVKQYPCTVTPNQCPTAGVRLMIIPEASAEQRDWESAMQPNRAGHVVAMVINVDGPTFTDLGLKSGERAYAWVGQIGTTANDRGFAIHKLGPKGVTAYTWFKTKDVSWCDNPEIRSKPAVKTDHPAGGKPCVRIGTQSASMASLPSHTTMGRASMLLGGLWISCSGGCCEVKGT
jgi:hypothetical protein